nr:phospho-sugar mutase [Corynebacterium vitaeruminis]
MNPELPSTARAWAEHDPDPATKQEILALIEEDNEAELASRFAGPLEFGTAGLRGRIGAGESRMNRAVVLRATFGLVSWLKENVSEHPRVVVGCDARYGSAQFHRDAAAVVSALGGTALVLDAKQPTPVTAYAVRALDADAGVMVTASHNPPRDNGYKVYLGGDSHGSQIIAPVDAGIAALIATAPPADEVPTSQENIEYIDVDYVDAVVDKVITKSDNQDGLRVVATAMHGVGGATLVRVLTKAGFTNVDLVTQQAFPDPDFPTATFPNPEEPGALDLALAKAREVDADIIVALDPDADRCAVACKHEGQWRQFTGDETGAVLGEWIARGHDAHPEASGTTLANSIVSGRLLGRIAAAHGMGYVNTLTGFKWISRAPELAFGYEEAIGFCCQPDLVRDKDGVSAALTLCHMAAELKKESKTLVDVLEELARTHGLYHTAPLTFRVEDLSILGAAMDKLRAAPPTELAGSKVVDIADLEKGGDLPPTNCLIFVTEDNDRVIVRPSGTEPKVKCYLEVVLPCSDEVPWDAARERIGLLKEQMKAVIGIA